MKLSDLIICENEFSIKARMFPNSLFSLGDVYGLDCSILPTLSNAGDVAGMAVYSCYGITEKETCVYGGLGDMQCSIRSCQPKHNEAGITHHLDVCL